jgi:hypothetical protein
MESANFIPLGDVNGLAVFDGLGRPEQKVIGNTKGRYFLFLFAPRMGAAIRNQELGTRNKEQGTEIGLFMQGLRHVG